MSTFTTEQVAEAIQTGGNIPYIIYGNEAAVREALDQTSFVVAYSGHMLLELNNFRTAGHSGQVVVFEGIASLSENDLYTAIYNLKMLYEEFGAPVVLIVPEDFALWGRQAAPISRYLNFLVIKE